MQLLINALIAGSLAALIASGLALVYGVLGVFNLALGQTVLMGGYGAWWFYAVAGWPLPLSILCGLVTGGFVAWITFEIFVNPFYKRHRFLPLVTTIALSMILDGLILLLFQERPRTIGTGVKRLFDISGTHVNLQQIVLILCTLVLLVALAYIVHSTSFGRRIRAMVQHDAAAMSLAINAPLLRRFVFILSGVFAAAGGIFIGIDQNLSPTLAFPLTIKAYAAIIAGGKGNIWGAVLCAYLIALLEQFLIGVHWFGMFYVPAGYQSTIALLFIIVVLLVKPSGLFASQARTT
jgi:branched-subunit amino acid ABC-type transport system permease component